ncbi:cation-dependent mannose-6-phosphate receptor-like [Argopecten irradians]|uniref:cation-dependent mannose-6-phosphate receptor-like n=1 Tax=Argopecten irradians TaxID=31199 RepID=UPI003715793D
MTSGVNMDSSVHVINIVWTLILISLSSPVQSDAQPCVKKGPCTCETSSYTVDLTPLSQRAGDSRLFKASDGIYNYVFSPCIYTGTPCGDLRSDVAICQETKNTPPETYVVGTQSSVKFSGNPDDGSLQIQYSANPRVGQVSVVCSDEEASFVHISNPNLTTYSFQLKTKYACKPSGLSPGSVMLIIFFVLLLVYIIGGILFMRYVRKAQGVEMIPNREMWAELPLLIKDGILFVSRGCKTESTYSQI